MAHLILFHHALGLTDGVESFAQALRREGHEVSVPDLYDGATFATVDEGVAHAEEVGFDHLLAAGTAIADDHPGHAVYGGFSLGGLL
ncbi:MAG: dienelactone hydrolase, partial [Actinobacteria bacterium]|nr:dienelactone hydrolase [Actinomycetota bacterium]NIV59390.1 dienelactone hydrolase [Actinomycetota bacterium]